MTFHGNFPVAEVEYCDPDFPARMRLTAFNPFIPSNVFDSNLPAAFFEWEIQNTSAQEITYTIAFSCRNPLLGRTEHHKANGKGYTGVRFSNSNLKHNADAGTALIATDCENTAIQEYWHRGEWFDALTTFWNDFSSPGPLKERHYARGNIGLQSVQRARMSKKTGRPGQLPYRPVWFSRGYAPERYVARDSAFLQRAIQPDGADVHRIV